MSSSDVLDVLNVKNPQKKIKKHSPSPNVPTANSNLKAPVTGIQRELYSLLGEHQPSIQVSQSRFKEKLQSTAKPSPWTNAPFKANDNVTLHHWVRGSKELLGSEIPISLYGKYNVHLTIPSFSEDEYNEFMKDTKDEKTSQLAATKEPDTLASKVSSPKTEDIENETMAKTNNNVEEIRDKSCNANNIWTFDEVQYLFELCRKYDMKWFVIQDRFISEKERSLEDLKAKFYEVCTNYFYSNKPDDPLLPSLNFNKDKEIERKKYLQRLLSRTAAEIAEEEALIIESRKFEMAAKKTLNEREALLRLLDSPRSDQSVAQYLSSQGLAQLYGNLLSEKTRKRKHTSNIPENPWMKQQKQFNQQRQHVQQLQEVKQEFVDALQSPKKTKKQKQELQIAQKRKMESTYAEQLLEKFNKEERLLLGVKAHGEKLNPGVYLRSTKMPSFKPALQNKVVAAMQELEIPAKPVMGTSKVLDRYEKLLKQIVTLTDLKRHYDKLEAEKIITKKK